MAGLTAALWLLGLYAAAPLLGAAGETPTLAGRLRDALILGIAIPFALAAIGLLFPFACWIVLVACVLLAHRRSTHNDRMPRTPWTPPLITIAALFAVAWPQLMRPLLDGDSLSYHLPNAAAWVHAHSLWTTATRYWWYPPGSELFASGLYSVAGPFALPWSGFCALALLGLRLAEWTRSDALAAAAITAYPLAIQGGTLQNDVWLAAFFVETLWLLRAVPPRLAVFRSVAVTTLIKPQGWIFAAIALAANRAPLRTWIVALAVAAAWLVHDVVLSKHALLSPAASSAYPHPFATTILAHAPLSLWLLVEVALRISPFALVALGAALAGPLLSAQERATGWAAFAAAIVFFVLPFGYETNVAQLATGESLRFAAPAIAAGAILLAPLARRFPAIATPLLLASVGYGIWYVLAIFWNDGGTHVALAVAVIAAAVTALAARMRVAWPAAVAVGAAVVLSTHLAARHPLDYYNDALSVRGAAPSVYRWMAATKPAIVDGVGLRLGVVNVLSPSTTTRDLLDMDICSTAQPGEAVVAVAQSDMTPQANASRLQAARSCGRIVYSDSLAAVTER